HHRHLHSFPTRRSSDLYAIPSDFPFLTSQLKGDVHYFASLYMINIKPLSHLPSYPMTIPSGSCEPSFMCSVGNIRRVVFPSGFSDRKSTRLNSSHVKIS